MTLFGDISRDLGVEDRPREAEIWDQCCHEEPTMTVSGFRGIIRTQAIIRFTRQGDTGNVDKVEWKAGGLG